MWWRNAFSNIIKQMSEIAGNCNLAYRPKTLTQQRFNVSETFSKQTNKQTNNPDCFEDPDYFEAVTIFFLEY